MKPTALFSLLVMTLAPLAAISGCKDNDLWGELPAEVSQFITQYFPNSSIDSFTSSATTYHVRIADGPGLTFSHNCLWEAINGYGLPLPKVLLFDQLPPALYSYLEETDNLGSVFSIERERNMYSVVLLSTTLHYNVSTEEITSDQTGATAYYHYDSAFGSRSFHVA